MGSIPIKKFLLISVLIFSFFICETGAFAQTNLPYPVPGETDGSKETDFEQVPISQTVPGYADPYNHRTPGSPPPVTGSSYYYLPPGVPSQGERIHSNYTKNTDACAACHATHVAEGPRLLQWSSPYKTCVACHDGTMGNYTYDVFGGRVGIDGKRASGGLFGRNLKIANDPNFQTNPDTLSNHMPDGTVTITAAPGGNPDANHNEVMDCISCHTPHGQGGNARILNPDPNKLRFKAAKANPNGILKKMEPVSFNTFKAAEANWIPGYPYNYLTRVIAAPMSPYYFWSEQGTLEMTGGIYLAPGEDYQIDFRGGKVILTITGMAKKGNQQIYASFIPGLSVVMRIDNYMNPTSERVTYLAKDANGNPSSLDDFCGVCHTDYNTSHFEVSYNKNTGKIEPHKSGSVPTGTFTTAFRHQVGNSWDENDWDKEPVPDVLKFSMNGADRIVTCLTCHLAHGVDKQYWNDTNDSYPDFPDDVADANGNSALKRLPNMAVCEACHQMRNFAKQIRIN